MVFNRLAAGPGGIDLAGGYPQLGTPPFLRDLLFDEFVRPGAADEPYGVSALRAAIADDFAVRQGVLVDPVENVTVTGSASEAVTAAVLTLARRGSAVVFFSPHFPVYSIAVAAAGAIPLFAAVALDGTFDVDGFGDLVAAGDVSAVILNSPHNPTGAVLSEIECVRLVEMCARRRIPVISDEVFAHLIPGISPAAVVDRNYPVVVVSDSGKKFDLRGFRLGWTIAGKELTRRIRIIQQIMTYRIPVPLQKTVIAGLRWASDHHYDGLRITLAANASILADAMPGAARPYQGGCFLLASVPGLTGTALSTRLAHRAEVHTLPATAFTEGRGPTAPDDFVRLSLARETSLIREAAARLAAVSGAGRSDRSSP
ncbi:pyridoxal phosphate-dependent aminotransferase [Dactylosporangium cerinum]|uniref:Pyridoxal phosphate-dependent aminotransferase n=1 Tax=Dactylosporangium cerinum TaxID=1434730 RepID=A0ABV9VZ56_9ACTN